MEVSSKAFLARILDNDNAETLGSDSFGIVGFGISRIGAVIVVTTSSTSFGISSILSGEGVAGVTSVSLGVAILLATSTIE